MVSVPGEIHEHLSKKLYQEKLNHYFYEYSNGKKSYSSSLWAKSLHAKFYEKDTPEGMSIHENLLKKGLKFRSYENLTKENVKEFIEERQELLFQLCRRIWERPLFPELFNDDGTPKK